MSSIDLYYLTPNTYGGWVTFTHHLWSTLTYMGHDVNLYKIRDRSEGRKRPFGYSMKYQNIDIDTATRRVKSGNPSLIVAAAKNFREQTAELLDAGCKLVVHDPTELKNLPDDLDTTKCVVIRRIGLETLPGSTFIRHPYVRMGKNEETERYAHAVSTCRIDFDKRTDILLDANRILKDYHRAIKIYGFENRLYTKFKICPQYPEWEQSKAAYPREDDAAFNILKQARYAVAMSVIKGDGGGTQYSFLEAWDAGAMMLINEEWITGDSDDMKPGINCECVSDGKSLANYLIDWSEWERIQFVHEGWRSLENHHPKIIGPQYEEFLKA